MGQPAVLPASRRERSERDANTASLETLSQQLGALVTDSDLQTFCDCTIVAGNGEGVLAVQFIVAARSPVLRNLLYPGTRPRNHHAELQLPGFSAEAVRVFVYFLHAGRLPGGVFGASETLNRDTAEYDLALHRELCVMQAQFAVPGLLVACTDAIVAGLTPQCVLTRWQWAVAAGHDNLAARCLAFAERHAEQVVCE
jgi:hypothetical protein